MAINRANFAKQLLPGLNSITGFSYNGVTDEHKPLFDIETSEKAFEQEVIMSGFATAPVKQEGQAVSYDTAAELWTALYRANTVALAFAITEEAIEDNLYDTISKIRAKALGWAMANTKQQTAADIFNNGFTNSAPYLGGDGVPLFSASHPTRSAGSLSNTASTDLSETALENAFINISLFKDDRNILVGAQPKSLHVPPQLMFVAQRIVASPGQTGTANNDINAIKSLGLLPGGFHVNHRFTDTNAWFVRTDIPDGLKMFVRTPLEGKMEGDFDTGNMRYKARERYSFGWTNWRAVYGSSGST